MSPEGKQSNASKGPVAAPQRVRHVRVHPLVRVALWAGALVLVLTFFRPITFVLVLLIAAAAFASVLAPIARRIPGPRWLGAGGAALAFWLVLAGLLALLGWLLAAPIKEQIQQWPQLLEQVNQTLANWWHGLGLQSPPTLSELARQLGDWLSGGAGEGVVTDVLRSVGVIPVGLAMVIFGSLYFLVADRPLLTRSLNGLLPGREEPLHRSLVQLESRYRRWLLGTLISMTAVGLASALGYWIIGLRFALALAMLAFFSEIVPTLGPFLQFLLALAVAAAQGPFQVVGLVVVYAIVQLLESYVLLPLVMRGAVHLPPLVTLFTVVLWARLLGPLGLLLALPINLTIWTLLENFKIARQSSPVS
jgi:predicted PurR-regulated permease PerM